MKYQISFIVCMVIAIAAVIAHRESNRKKAPDWVMEWATNNWTPTNVVLLTNGQRIEMRVYNTTP